MIIRPNPKTDHASEELKGKRRGLVLGKCRDNRAPSGGRFGRSFIENLQRKMRQLGLGVEVDQMVGDERDGL